MYSGGVRGIADDAALRGHDRLIAAALEGAAHQLFVGERAVDVGCVEQGDAELEGPVQGGDRLGFVAGAVELAHSHAAEAHGGNSEWSQLLDFHELFSPRGGRGYLWQVVLATSP